MRHEKSAGRRLAAWTRSWTNSSSSKSNHENQVIARAWMAQWCTHRVDYRDASDKSIDMSKDKHRHQTAQFNKSSTLRDLIWRRHTVQAPSMPCRSRKPKSQAHSTSTIPGSFRRTPVSSGPLCSQLNSIRSSRRPDNHLKKLDKPMKRKLKWNQHEIDCLQQHRLMLIKEAKGSLPRTLTSHKWALYLVANQLYWIKYWARDPSSRERETERAQAREVGILRVRTDRRASRPTNRK